MAYVYTWTPTTPLITDLVRDGAQQIREGVKGALNERLLSVFVNLTSDPLQHKTLVTVDNTYDLGSSAARFKAGYVNALAINNANVPSAGNILLANTGVLQSRNALNSASLNMVSMDAANLMQLYAGAGTLAVGGSTTWGIGTGGTNVTMTLNGGSSNTIGSYIGFQRNGVDTGRLGTESVLLGNNNNHLMMYSFGSRDIKFYPAGVSSMTLSSTNQSVTFDGALLINGSGGGGVAGAIFKSATDGMAMRGIAGSSYDFTIGSTGGTHLLRNPTGTLNWQMPAGSLTVGVGVVVTTGGLTVSAGTTSVVALTASGTITSTGTTGGVVLSYNVAGTTAVYSQFLNTTGGIAWGVEGTPGGTIIAGSSAYDAAIRSKQGGIAFSTNDGGTLHARLSATGAWTTAAAITATTGDITATAGILIAKAAASNVGAGAIGYGGTTQTTVGGAGGASALPATPRGYVIINVAGTNRVMPFYDAV